MVKCGFNSILPRRTEFTSRNIFLTFMPLRTNGNDVICNYIIVDRINVPSQTERKKNMQSSLECYLERAKVIYSSICGCCSFFIHLESLQSIIVQLLHDLAFF